MNPTSLPTTDLVHHAGADAHDPFGRDSVGPFDFADEAPIVLETLDVSAWFGGPQVLDRVSLAMEANEVMALIGPSGCGKSTYLRILNRMHEMIAGAEMAGEVLLDGEDIYDPKRRFTDVRKRIGMVFQKPNPFPAMSIYDNVLAGLKLTGPEGRSATRRTRLSSRVLWRRRGCGTKCATVCANPAVRSRAASSSASASRVRSRCSRRCC